MKQILVNDVLLLSIRFGSYFELNFIKTGFKKTDKKVNLPQVEKVGCSKAAVHIVQSDFAEFGGLLRQKENSQLKDVVGGR